MAKKTVEQALKELESAVQATYAARLGLNTQESIDKLGWLKDSKRDFTKVTPELQEAAKRAVVQSIRDARGDISDVPKLVDKMAKAAGEAVLEHICKRFQGGKRDVKLRPLAKSTVKRKGHNRVGIDSGDLLRDILSGVVVLRRVK